jgi:hypothetical protein
MDRSLSAILPIGVAHGGHLLDLSLRLYPRAKSGGHFGLMLRGRGCSNAVASAVDSLQLINVRPTSGGPGASISVRARIVPLDFFVDRRILSRSLLKKRAATRYLSDVVVVFSICAETTNNYSPECSAMCPWRIACRKIIRCGPSGNS